MRSRLAQRARDLRLSRKLAALVVVYILIIAVLLSASVFSLKAMNATRAFVGGEGLWSKAQKGSTIHLLRFADTGDENEFAAYERDINVTLGDRQARLELEKTHPDMEVARAGFLQGRNDPADVDNMIFLFRTFRHVSYVDHAIRVWAEGDREVDELQALAQQLRDAKRAGDAAAADRIVASVEAKSVELTALEDEFSFTLGEAARFVDAVTVGTLVGGTAVFLAVAATASFYISRNITHEATSLRAAAQRVARGDLDQRVEVRSRDEFGDLSTVFNEMTEALVLARRAVEEKTRELADAQNLARLGSFTIDPTRGTIHMSDELYALLGRAPRAAAEPVTLMREHIVPDDREMAMAHVRDAVEKGTTFDFDERVVRTDGVVRTFHARGRRVDVAGETRVLGTVLDVTEQKEAERALREASVARPLARRLLLDLVLAGRLSSDVLRDIGRQLAKEDDRRELPALLRTFGELGLGELRLGSVADPRYEFSGRDLLERRPSARMTTCAFTLGYLMGALSSVTGADVKGSEVACQSKGDDACRFVLRVAR